MKQKLTSRRVSRDPDDFNIDDVLETKELLEKEDYPQPNSKSHRKDHIDNLVEKIGSGQYVQEAVRDIVFDATKSSYGDTKVFDPNADADPSQDDTSKVIRKKKKELYEVLDNLDDELAGKSVKEVTAYFSSLLSIQGQLCLQKTDGVISVRTRLSSFLPQDKCNGTLRDSLRQEISLLFTPEEVRAIRAKLPEMEDDDPLHPFLTYVLDQAYDVIQYSEMTGRLLLEMTTYFLRKLQDSGYGDTTQTLDFKERHERSRLSLERAINDLRMIEAVINNHLQKYPILIDLPKLLRQLIQVKLGLMELKHVSRIIQQISSKLGEYARARSAVAFDFNRLPSFQHGVRLRQSIIMNLHKDVLKYLSELFRHEFLAVKDELDQITREIEAASESLQPDSPEYQELMVKKSIIQKKLEEHRRKLDVVKSQERLVDVQHKMVGEAVQRYNRNEILQQKLEEQLQAPRIEKEKKRSPAAEEEKKRGTSRMVVTKRTESH